MVTVRSLVGVRAVSGLLRKGLVLQPLVPSRVPYRAHRARGLTQLRAAGLREGCLLFGLFARLLDALLPSIARPCGDWLLQARGVRLIRGLIPGKVDFEAVSWI